MNTSELVALFKAEVESKAKRIDPNNGEDWFSLTLGWAIAKGLTPARARTFACRVRYAGAIVRQKNFLREP